MYFNLSKVKMGKDVIFKNKCGWCRHYKGIMPEGRQQIYRFNDKSTVDCSRGIIKMLKDDCNSYSPIGGRDCSKCFYAYKNQYGYECKLGNDTNSFKICYESALEDYYVESSGSFGGCYISTVVCIHQNLPDDCIELTTLRKFRDTELLTNQDGINLVQEYYREAPELAQELFLNRELSNFIFSNYILPLVGMINKNEDKIKIIDKYSEMFLFVKGKLRG